MDSKTGYKIYSVFGYYAGTNETHSGIVMGEGVEVIKIVPICIAEGIPLMHQPMVPLHKDLAVLLLESLHLCGLEIIV
jgi:hypothetical protein